MPPIDAEPIAGLSVAIVCKDNAGTIGRTLRSVSGLATEIVAVDSGSTDGTLDILSKFGARIIPSEWMGHVRTKQAALTACAGEWVLSLDSDESIEPELAASIRAALADSPSGTAGYRMNRRTYYKDRPLMHAWQPEWRLRLVRRERARWTGLDPHDRMEILESAEGSGRGRVSDLAGVMRHDSFVSFAEHLRKQWGHSLTGARSLHAAGVRASYWKLLTSPGGAFLKQLVLKGAWRDGYAGWLASASASAAALMKHAMLIEIEREQG